ncbi:MAG: ExsB family protein [Acidimicrobiales bacterium]|nr:ExsB family protein [Acidimicrobiales bacterium]
MVAMSAPSLPSSRAALDHKLAALQASLRGFERVVVAFSGGADSAFLAWSATDVLGVERVHCVTAVSPSLPGAELDACAEVARSWGLRWTSVPTDEMEDAAYRRNDADRCYWCKDALMRALGPLAAAAEATVVLGVNVDDLGDHRPGQRAAQEQGAAFPLVAAGLTKADVREASRQAGLVTWDKPAAACLASRLPYGTPVTVGVLASVEQAEAGLRALGFDDLRVRHYRELARIEVPVARLAEAVERREAIVAAVAGAGYRYVTLDLEGLRSGNLNGQLVSKGRS